MTKPTIDEQIDDIVVRCFDQGKYWGKLAYAKTDRPDNPIDRTQANQALKALLTEARIDTLKLLKLAAHLGQPEDTIKLSTLQALCEEQIAQLKNEATDPVKRVRELRDEWEQRSNK